MNRGEPVKSQIVFLIALLWGLQAAHAGESREPNATEQPQEPAGSWVIQVTPYVWATGLEGDVSPFRQGPTVRVDKSFSEVMEDLEVAGFVNIWARRDRLVLSGDVMYVSTAGSGSTGRLPAIHLPGTGGTLPAGSELSAGVRSKQFMFTVQAGTRIIDEPGFTLDALGGLRYWKISNEATISAHSPGLGTIRLRHDENFSWADPLIGLRAFAHVNDRLSVQTQADIGGFGAGSNLTWSVLATLNYSFSDRLSASAGYRVLKVDYEHKGNVFNTRLAGPVLGLTYRF